MIVRDKDGCTWRPNPQVDGEWQIKLPGTDEWSDADLLPADGPFAEVCFGCGCGPEKPHGQGVCV